jgi:CBS domain-containing protein
MPDTSTLVDKVMTTSPTTVTPDTSVVDAARLMRQDDIGDVLVVDADGQLMGLVTDRDLVVRGIAENADSVSEVCSEQLVTVAPDDSVDECVDLMRANAIRRLPVVRGGMPVGVVSIGDIAEERDRQSALAQISEADSNH